MARAKKVVNRVFLLAVLLASGLFVPELSGQRNAASTSFVLIGLFAVGAAVMAWIAARIVIFALEILRR